ncbi:MAG TPA: hypothetical protein DDY78_28610 [Planctomycetales bacterium]|jgi:hypothetical protein|nr:hypothetical protein [Planctomycetales bacterium]
MSIRKYWALHALVLLLTLYVGSYLYLSRRGAAECDALGYMPAALYFSPPQPSREWERWNFGCVWFYWPLIKADFYLGTGRWPGSAPLWDLKK